MRSSSSLLLATVAAAGCLAQDVCYGDIDDIITFESLEDIEVYADCTTLQGTISVDESYLGPLFLDNLQYLNGSIKFSSAPYLTSISFSNLLEVAGGVSIKDLELLYTLDLSSLTSIGGALEISNNEILDTLGGIDVEYIESISISNNSAVRSIQFPSLKNVTSDLEIIKNGFDASVELPSLIGTGVLYIANAASIELPNLTDIYGLGGQLVISDCTFTKLSVPKLRWTRESFWVKDNQYLVEVDFPSLTTVGQGAGSGSARGTLVVSGESIESISFELLEYVQSGVYLHGDFSEIDFPLLSSGPIVVATQNPDFDCTAQSSTMSAQGLGCTLCASGLSSFSSPSDGDINIDGGLIGGIVDDLWNYGGDICDYISTESWGSSTSSSPASSTTTTSSSTSSTSKSSTSIASTSATSSSSGAATTILTSISLTTTASTSTITISSNSTSTTNSTSGNLTSTPIPFAISNDGNGAYFKLGTSSGVGLGLMFTAMLFFA